MKNILLAFALLTTASSALAAETIPFTYEAFEASVPHADMEECPASMNVKNAFCRLTLHTESFHVFAFSQDGDQPLVAFKTFEENQFDLDLK